MILVRWIMLSVPRFLSATPGSLFEEPAFEPKCDGVGTVRCTQLREQIRCMGFDREGSEEETLTDLGIGAPFRHKRKDLQLSFRKCRLGHLRGRAVGSPQVAHS